MLRKVITFWNHELQQHNNMIYTRSEKWSRDSHLTTCVLILVAGNLRNVTSGRIDFCSSKKMSKENFEINNQLKKHELHVRQKHRVFCCRNCGSAEMLACFANKTHVQRP